MRDLFPVAEGVGFLVVPGDNDIGGEGSDGMMEEVNRWATLSSALDPFPTLPVHFP